MQLGLSPAALEERRKGIGGSDAGRISRALWLEKTGRVEPEDLSGNLAVQMGSATESFNAFWFEKVTGRKVERRGEVAVSASYPWMRANLDGVTTTTDGSAYAYWDAKHVGKADQAMLLRYTPQMTHCCTILGLDYWVLSVFVGNSRHEIFEQEVDTIFQRQLIKRERELWGFIERDEDPGDRFEEKPSVPLPAPKMREIVVPTNAGDPVFAALCQRENWLPEALAEVQTFASTHAAATLHAIKREAIKKLIPEDVGRLEYGLFTYKRDGRGQTLSLAKGEDE